VYIPFIIIGRNLGFIEILHNYQILQILTDSPRNQTLKKENKKILNLA
jgi:hypothetical protein